MRRNCHLSLEDGVLRSSLQIIGLDPVTNALGWMEEVGVLRSEGPQLVYGECWPFSAVACHLSAGNIKSALLRLCQDKTKLGTRQLARCVSGLRQKPSETPTGGASALVPEQTYSLQTKANSLALLYSRSRHDTVSSCFPPSCSLVSACHVSLLSPHTKRLKKSCCRLLSLTFSSLNSTLTAVQPLYDKRSPVSFCHYFEGC